MERKRRFVGGQLHGTEIDIGMTVGTFLQYRKPEDFPTDPLRLEAYRTLKLSRKTPAGTQRRRFRVLRGIKRAQALQMTLRAPHVFWADPAATNN